MVDLSRIAAVAGLLICLFVAQPLGAQQEDAAAAAAGSGAAATLTRDTVKARLEEIEATKDLDESATRLARMLGRMESAELISRTVDAADSRVNRITLTDQGRQLAEQMAPQRDRALSLAVQGLGEKEVVELKRLLNQLYRSTLPTEHRTP